ncbi:amidohydrolase/deacetylase family metallohydrolase [Aeromonas caviae]|uniref:amidohydrolase/deacetylase family metallohydrolase n=1 Tax=Aeromonas TaxID=642 RepID=UPI0006A5EFFF|nr:MULTISPECIES: amidohydrolase/deacetylase family metallohydrolase [Aeromonas]KOG95275.1 dihydroorotase [Aeromonas caviae]MBA8780811.1 amidohydrolase/deacetylase family metallohydrolase [Aeromonas caviae]MBA8784866.1 amidohydrolase/deacetylase family metallohydrolase [Aeromonas sp. TW 6]MBL0556052.1 amidohydrolase/deacetylase family metallohydrolase [Aeromonas caviae]MDX7813896.1 amidohydrolase/deacetylase family metallohydrolase [Aeromonas caviae]
MYDMIIRAGRLGNGQLVDVAIKHGKIAALGSLPESTEAKHTLTLGGQVHVSAGWIDGHTHCYPASPIYHDEPDKVGVESGVTTVIDAGSTGADDVDDFQRLAATCKTRVHALLNISRIGLLRQNELADPADIDPVLAQAAIRRHPGFIVGIKARMSGSVVGESGLQPLRMAKQIQQANGNLPLMVHVGNTPPDLDEIVALLGEGDLLTHCFNGKPNRILTPAGELRQAVREAMRRGLLLDIGHGGASFSFEVAELAIAQGILPHTISSDIYCKNRIKGPVYSLAHVMSKFFAIGMTLEQVLACVTHQAADALRLPGKGRLEMGADADITLFEVSCGPTLFTDTEAGARSGDRQLLPLAALVGGELVLTHYGKSHHAFCV